MAGARGKGIPIFGPSPLYIAKQGLLGQQDQGNPSQKDEGDNEDRSKAQRAERLALNDAEEEADAGVHA